MYNSYHVTSRFEQYLWFDKKFDIGLVNSIPFCAGDSFQMATFRLVFISILMLSTGWAAQNFLPVSVCPRDKNTWKFESDRKNCQGDTPDYLCAAIENQVGNFGEICTKFGLTPDCK